LKEIKSIYKLRPKYTSGALWKARQIGKKCTDLKTPLGKKMKDCSSQSSNHTRMLLPLQSTMIPLFSNSPHKTQESPPQKT